LLLLTAVAAVCALMVRTSDWLAAAGFALAAIVFLVAVNSPLAFVGPMMSRGIRALLVLVALTGAWFTVVDRSEWLEGCPGCGETRSIHQYRVCGIPCSSRIVLYKYNHLSRLRSDLGMPCGHEFERQHRVRAWGLVYYARPCIGGTWGLAGDSSYYNEDVSRRVRAFAKDNPEEARELCKHILDDDYAAMRAFLARIKSP